MTTYMGSGTGPEYPENPAAIKDDAAFARICAEHGDASLPAQLSQRMMTTKDAQYGTKAEKAGLSETRRRVLGIMKSLNAKIEKAGSFSEDEDATFNKCSAIMDHLTARIEVIDRTLDCGDSRSLSRPEWTDAQGNPVSMLDKSQKVADVIARRTGQNAANLPRTSMAATVQAMVTGDHSRIDSMAAAGGFQASLVTGADPDGGFFVSPALAGNLIDHARARSTAINAGVRTMVMEQPEVRIVRVEDDPEFEFTGEGGKFPESTPPFGMVRLVAKKLGVQIPVSAELIEDAVGLQNELDRLLGESLAASIDSAIYTGDGSKGSFTGILAASGVQEHAATLPNVLSWDDLLDAQLLLDNANLGTDTSLVFPPAMARQLRGQKDTQDRFIQPPADLANLPRASSTNLPATSAVHGRFSEGILGIRSQLSIQVNPYAKSDRDMILITARWRGDFAITRPAGLVKLTGFDGATA